MKYRDIYNNELLGAKNAMALNSICRDGANLVAHAQINHCSATYIRVSIYALRTTAREETGYQETEMSDLKVYNHVSENAKQDSLEQDLAEKLTRETPRSSSDGE